MIPRVRADRGKKISTFGQLVSKSGQTFPFKRGDAVFLNGFTGPFLEGTVKGTGVFETEQVRNFLGGDGYRAQIFLRKVGAEFIAQLLVAEAFLAQMTTQGTRADLQLVRHSLKGGGIPPKRIRICLILDAIGLFRSI